MGKNTYVYADLASIKSSTAEGSVLNVYGIILSCQIKPSGSNIDGNPQYLSVELATKLQNTPALVVDGNPGVILVKIYPNDASLNLPTAVPKYSIVRLHRIGIFHHAHELRGKLGVRGCSLLIWRLGDPEKKPSYSSSVNFTLTPDDLETIKRLRKEVSVYKQQRNCPPPPPPGDAKSSGQLLPIAVADPFGNKEMKRRKLDEIRPKEYFDVLIHIVAVLKTKSGGSCVIRGWDGSRLSSNLNCTRIREDVEEGIEILSMDEQLNQRLKKESGRHDDGHFMVDIFCYGQFDVDARKLKAGDFVVLFNCHSYVSKDVFYSFGLGASNTCQLVMHSLQSTNQNRFGRAIKVLDPTADAESVQLADTLNLVLNSLPDRPSPAIVVDDKPMDENDAEEPVCSTKSVRRESSAKTEETNSSLLMAGEGGVNDSADVVDLPFLHSVRQTKFSRRKDAEPVCSKSLRDEPANKSQAGSSLVADGDADESDSAIVGLSFLQSVHARKSLKFIASSLPDLPYDERDDLQINDDSPHSSSALPCIGLNLPCSPPEPQRTETWNSTEFIDKLQAVAFGTRFRVDGPLRIINDKRYGVYPNPYFPESSSRLFIFSCPKCSMVLSNVQMFKLHAREDVFCPDCKDTPLTLYFRFVCFIVSDPNREKNPSEWTKILFHGPSAEKAVGLSTIQILHCWINDLMNPFVWRRFESLVGKTWSLTEGEVIPHEVATKCGKKVCLVHSSSLIH